VTGHRSMIGRIEAALAVALAAALLPDDGWYANFEVANEDVAVFANRVFLRQGRPIRARRSPRLRPHCRHT
jgi:hypothetical protein